MSNGFTVIVGRLAIHAMRRTPSGEVQANQSDAQSFHVYMRGPGGAQELQRTEEDFDAAFAFCVQRPAVH